MRFEAPTTVKIVIVICALCCMYQRFAETYDLFLQGRRRAFFGVTAQSDALCTLKTLSLSKRQPISCRVVLIPITLGGELIHPKFALCSCVRCRVSCRYHLFLSSSLSLCCCHIFLSFLTALSCLFRIQNSLIHRHRHERCHALGHLLTVHNRQIIFNYTPHNSYTR
jgi:hypothetical protein